MRKSWGPGRRRRGVRLGGPGDRSFAIWGALVSDSWWVPYTLLIAGLAVWNLVALRGEGARVVLYALALFAVLAAGHSTLGLVQAGVFVAALTLARLPEVQGLITRARHGERAAATEPTGVRRA